MKYLIILIFLIFSVSCSSFKSISKKIDRLNSLQKPLISGHKIRMELYKNGHLNFVNYESDTLFFIQNAVDLETLIYSGMVLNNTNKICYTYSSSDKLKIDDKFCSDTKFIQKWDTLSIKKNSLKGHSIKDNIVYVDRVIIKNKKLIAIQKLNYNDFLKL